MKRWLLVLLCALPMLGQSAGYTQTRYPIVLVHGLFGFDRLCESAKRHRQKDADAIKDGELAGVPDGR